MPFAIRPPILSVYNYLTAEGIYLWNEVLEADPNTQSPLNQYSSYNADFYKPYRFFDTLAKLLQLFPKEQVVRCSDMPGTVYDRSVADYVRATNNNQTDCSLDDSVWFSPACRRNTSQCVPLITQYDMNHVIQLAFFFNWPIAAVQARYGTADDDAAYFGAIRGGRFLFGWFQPDDSLVDSAGNQPTIISLPPTNALEQSQNVFRTAIASVQPRNYVWQDLESVDRRVHYMLANVNFYQQDMDALMEASAALRAADVDNLTASRRLACGWVRDHAALWRDWLPASCPPGSSTSSSLNDCSAT